MFLHALYSTCMDITAEAELQGNAMVEDILSQRAESNNLTCLGDGDIVKQMRPMADPVRPAVLQGLPYGFLAK